MRSMVPADITPAAAQKRAVAAHVYPKREMAFFIDLPSLFLFLWSKVCCARQRGTQRLTQEKTKCAAPLLRARRDSHKALQCNGLSQWRRRIPGSTGNNP